MKVELKKELEKGTYLDISLKDEKTATLSYKGEDIAEVEVKDPKIFKNRKLKAVVKDVGYKYHHIEIVRFADLHRHSGYSLLDGATKIEDMVEKTEYVGALTDHGVMFGFLPYYKAMKKAGKQPIVGFEAYAENMDGKKEGNHLLLLAKTEQGYKNLVKLTSKGYENFYSKPHVSYEMLKEHKDGIIALSACLGGEIPQLLIKDKYDKAKEVAEWFVSVYGDDFYLEIQNHEMGYEEEKVNTGLQKLSKELGLKLVATTDSHYTNEEDSKVHEVLLCLQTGKDLDDPSRMKFSGNGYHIHTADDMDKRFSFLPEAIDNTLEIAVKTAGFSLDLGSIYMPKFDIPEGYTENSYFEKLSWDGFKNRFEGRKELTDPVYIDRMKTEIEIIQNMGFSAYFLIVSDFIGYAKDNEIMVGPGRGSAVGSLVSYALNIVDLDPIPYDLLFERFLNPERVSMPDIDIDFCFERREEVIEYVKNKYGENSVSKIITFGTLGARSVVRDVARVKGHPYALGDRIAKLIPNEIGMTLDKALEVNPDLFSAYKAEHDVKDVIDTAKKLEGLPRHASQHACFDADTLINTSKGYKKIIDVIRGDIVLTHNKRYMPVVATMVTNATETFKVKTASSFPIEVTGNHPLYVKEMKYENYKNKDGVWGKRKTFNKPSWKAVNQLTEGLDYVGIPINSESIIPKKDSYDLPFERSEFWWLVGRYVGDGWTEVKEHKYKNGNRSYENKIVICCSKKTEDEKDIISRYLDKLNFSYRVENARTTYKLNMINQHLFDYLQEFGKYAHNKKLNKDVLNLPINLAESFFEGYHSADGHYLKKQHRHSLKTTSKELAVGVMHLIHKVFKRPASVVWFPPGKDCIEGRRVNRREKYQISFTMDVRKGERSVFEDGYIWSRVSYVKKSQNMKNMYNLTVLNDSSYTVNNLSAHNCGVIISDGPVDNYLPEILMGNDKTGKVKTSQVVMTEVEELGLLKMDFLGLRTMTVIGHAIESIRRTEKTDLKSTDIPHFDPYVYADIAKGKTYGVFQLESGGMRNFMVELYSDVDIRIKAIEKKFGFTGFSNPKGNGDVDSFLFEMKDLGQELFERLIAGISLYRPGPMDFIPDYLSGMRDPDNIEYDHPKLEPILKATYGTIVYQESVMQIVQQLAGYTLGRADLVRRAMGKKKIEVMNEEKEYFINGKLDKEGNIEVPGCVRNGISKETAETIWHKMEDFSKYAFNKSHSAGYALIGVTTAWLKYYYPVDFMAATMNSFIDKQEKLKVYLSVAKNMEIEILPPDFNKSLMLFSREGKHIIFGLKAIRNMGATAEKIITEREKRGMFKDFQDFAERMTVHQTIDKSVLEAMIYSGAVDSSAGTRRAKLSVLEMFMKAAKRKKMETEQNQVTIFDLFAKARDLVTIEVPDLDEFEKRYKLEQENHYAGFYVTEHPLDDYHVYFKNQDIKEVAEFMSDEEDDVKDSYDGHRVKIAGIIREFKVYYTKKGNKPLYVFKVEDRTGSIDAIMFSRQIDSSTGIKEGAIAIFEGELKDDDRGLQLVINNSSEIESLLQKDRVKEVRIRIADDDMDTLKDLLSQEAPGENDLYVYVNKKRYKYPNQIDIKNLSLFSDLRNKFGEENVKIEYLQ